MKPAPKQHHTLLQRKNRHTATWLCAGVFTVYNGFFAAITASKPDPGAHAADTFNRFAAVCIRNENVGDTPHNALGRIMGCIGTGAGAAGIAVGGLIPKRDALVL